MEMIKLKDSISLEEKAAFTTRESERGLILLDMSRDKIYEVNESGAEIVKLIQKGAKFDEIVEAMLEIYEVKKDVLENDVNKFLKKLKELNLLSQ